MKEVEFALVCRFRGMSATALRILEQNGLQQLVRTNEFKAALTERAFERSSQHLLVDPPQHVTGAVMLLPLEMWVRDIVRNCPKAIARFCVIWIRDGEEARVIQSRQKEYPVGSKVSLSQWEIGGTVLPLHAE